MCSKFICDVTYWFYFVSSTRWVHAFIVMCDINDTESLRNSLEWIEQIQARATIHDKVIAVFANKCD